MVDEVITKQELIDAQKDAQSLDDFINGGDKQIVVTRLLKEYPTLANAIRQIYEKGGKFYPTLAEANADIANIRTDVYVITGDNGAYYKATAEAPTLTKSAYDPQTQVLKKVVHKFDTLALLQASKLERYTYAVVLNDTNHDNNGYYQKDVNDNWYRVRFNSENEIRNFLSKKGFAQIFLVQPSNANYSTINKTLTITGGASVVTNRAVYPLTTPITLSFPDDKAYSLVFNEATSTLKVADSTAVKEDGWLFCGTVNKTASGLSTNIFRDFLVDGVAQTTLAELAAQDIKKADLQSLELSIDPTTRTMSLPYGGDVYTAKARIFAAVQSFNYSDTTGVKYIMFEKATKLLSSVTQGQSVTLMNANTHYLLFMYDPVTQFIMGYTGKVRFIGTTPATASAKGNYVLALIREGGLNFDFNNHKIVISENIWIPYNGFRLSVPAQTIALDPARNTAFRTLIYVNPANSSIVLGSSASGAPAIPTDHVLIGAYQENIKAFWGLSNFNVNGEPFENKKEKVKPIFGWDVNNKLDVNIADSFTPTDTLPLLNIKTADVYGWYDALVAAYPDYVTKTVLGKDSSGLFDINMYRFNPQRVGTDGRLSTKIPKVMMLALHNEAINFVYPYTLLREVCNNWQNSEALESMRFGMEFVVIPILNPWGLDNDQRKNFNQVNLNTNFPVGWIVQGTIADSFYSGPSSMSEVETQYAYATMLAEKPDIYFDCHSYGPWNTNGRSIWQTILNDKTRVAAMSTAEKMYAQYKKKYNWLVDLNELVYLSDSTITGGGLSAKSAESVGAVGGTIEFAWNLKNEPTGATGHNSIVNFATDYLGTSILQVLSVIINSR